MNTSHFGLSMSLLAVLFVGLKLTDQIDWSWWAVLAPIWGPPALGLIILNIALLWVALSIAWNSRCW